MLSARIVTRYDEFTLAVDFETSRDEVLAVVGPNGAGKSTLLRALAGLRPLQSGYVSVNGDVWDDTDRGIRRPAESRNTGYVPQAGLLFPHLTAIGNVAFGIGDDRPAALAALDRLGMADLAQTMPKALSGGQIQLVALARALVRAPDLLLLDEPLASIDASNRAAVRRVIRRELRHSPGYRILVTHDPLEAAALADRVMVLDAGRVTQVGSLDDLRTHPRSSYVAELVGMNFFTGSADRGVITTEGGATLVSASVPDGPVFATVHPRAVSLYSARPSGSPRNVWDGVVAAIEPSLDQVRIHVTGSIDLVAEVTHAGAGSFSERDEVWVSVKASEVFAYPR